MLTVQILTKNNLKTVRQTFDSLEKIQCQFIVGDFGSTDGTISYCESKGAKVYCVNGMNRSQARNHLLKHSPKGINFYIEPWECVIQGWSFLNAESDGVVKIMRGSTVSHEKRMWNDNSIFVNPVFERLNKIEGKISPIVLASEGSVDSDYALEQIDLWKKDKPLSPSPYYYQACILFSQEKYEDYIKLAEHYLFLEKKEIMPITITRYYYSMAQIVHKKSHKIALQNINMCLCVKPLMAEFWCLMADVYYHLLNRFDAAKSFYQNAIELGSKRLRSDLWPMDFSKYGKYPKKMIESCDDIINRFSEYKIKNNSHLNGL